MMRQVLESGVGGVGMELEKGDEKERKWRLEPEPEERWGTSVLS